MSTNPSWRIDELARRVLEAAKWRTLDLAEMRIPTPHLDELERALEINLSPLLPTKSSSGDGGSSVKTCTVPSGLAKQNDGNHNNDQHNNNEVWTWTPSMDNDTENSYDKPTQSSHNNNNITTDYDMTLEELAPFSPEFYRAMGELVKEAFQSGSVKDITAARSNESTPSSSSNSGGNSRDATKKAILSLDRYSLPRMHDAVRVTRILLSMQELNVGSSGDDKFITSLLHYCEGMPMTKIDEKESKETEVEPPNNVSNTQKTVRHSTANKATSPPSSGEP